MKNLTNSLYEILVNTMPHGIAITDTKGRFILWNKTAEEMFPISMFLTPTRSAWASVFGAYTVDRKQEYKFEDLPLSKSLRGQWVKCEKVYIKNDKYPAGLYLRISSYPLIEDNELKAAAVVFEDITEEQLIFDEVINKFEEIKLYLTDVLKVDYATKKVKINPNESIKY